MSTRGIQRKKIRTTPTAQRRASGLSAANNSISVSDLLESVVASLTRIENKYISGIDQQNAALRDLNDRIDRLGRPSEASRETASTLDPADLLRSNALKPRVPAPPAKLQHIQHAVDEGRSILSLTPEDLDDDERPYSEDVLERAVAFLWRTARWTLSQLGQVIDAPRVLPGSHGSIDLFWSSQDYELLINVPKQGTIARFYGDDRGKLSIKGTVELASSNVPLCLFLARTP